VEPQTVSANRRRSVRALSFILVLSFLLAVGSLAGIFRKNARALTTPAVNGLAVLETPPYVPALSSGHDDEYRCFILDPKLTVNSFLQSVSITPVNPRISHHGILYRLPAAGVEAAKSLDAKSAEHGWPCFGDSGIPGAGLGQLASSAGWISFWSPGGNFKQFPAGTGMKMDIQDQFILQVHYHARPRMTSNAASMKVKLKFATTSVEQLRTSLLAAPIELPCGQRESGPLCDRTNAIADLKKRTIDTALWTNDGLELKCGGNPINPIPSSISTCTQTVPATVKIYGVTGHMHKLGKSIVISLQDGVTGNVTTLSSQPVWNFDNQKTQWMNKPLMAKAGDVLKVTCTYDVKLRSLLPELKKEPPRYVVWGEGSNDEMCLAIINYVG